MTTTYCVSTDIVLDSGKSIDSLFASDLTAEQITTMKDTARLRAYNFINDNYLLGKTLVPATHIPSLKQIEIDLVLSFLFGDSFSMERSNVSDWGDHYKKRAEEALKILRFDSSSEAAAAASDNVGNGTISAITTNNEFTRTEQWILRASGAVKFSVFGTRHGYLPEITVGTKYPERDWTRYVKDYNLTLAQTIEFHQFPISLLITAGNVAFTADDKFTFKTFAASYFRRDWGEIIRA